ncbi:glutathione reductase [Neoasaia chiangmaiensis NBRC 101099]|uniref:NAD(FAD)-utilizing dehydrogenase n=1 Tax=Neoasaia chiangmaiensis TaxID=320497 RepID=A0A1U9KPP2_9PROT|nr:TIGR03862 family flavoprotein [Neoasaia chiangmaiensis]AQS87748.1 NAD(FAD)-utilizing dehydrogenase [Neoasaia chiangmaiensis]GBR41678.1 glutathione reductase [Neoasaia chiangmaiensis NBRC 101099]GEN14344.1 NAD(FAD)-utilizing dehydrogenase [Neoasaia chiangmaiensis]
MSDPRSPFIAVIGAGPAGLFAAEYLAAAGHRVVVHDRMAHPARKFLMAGASGLNLTHAEGLPAFLDRYGAARDWLEPAIRDFPPEALRAWAEGLGQPCFVGSSGRVFPESMKASPLLRAWLARLRALGVTFAGRHRWRGWHDDALVFETPDGMVRQVPAATVLALGGASWARLGSDGAWAGFLPTVMPGAVVAPFRPSNCGFLPGWPPERWARAEGAVLHGVTLRHRGRAARGDLTFTAHGIEGAPIYALSGPLRDAIARDGAAEIAVDLRPGMDAAALAARLGRLRPRESLSNRLRKGASLSPVARVVLGAVADLDAPALAARIKAAPLRLIATEAMDRAISVAGGVRASALDSHFMFRDRPGVFAAGEMLDWEAPTGGYLLQACFATGLATAKGVDAWLTSAATSCRTRA